jgi:TetR/AcrR family transcriptional regulator, cholesterol catabolism regulator
MRASTRENDENLPEKHCQRREAIRDTAAAVFAAKGFHGCSVQDVADALKINKATLYHYYQSKEQMLFDIVSYADAEIMSMFAAVENSEMDPIEATRRSVTGHVMWYLRHPDVAKVAFLDWASLTGEYLQTQVARRRTYGHVLRKHIIRCKKHGLIPETVNIGLATNFINGAVATANVWFRPDGTESAEKVAKAFGDMAIALLIGQA